MSVFGSVLLAVLASLGIALSILELVRVRCARKAEFICLCFDERMLEGEKPDMLVICRTDAEQEEIIRRVCSDESRRVYIKKF